MPQRMTSRFTWLGVALSASLVSGCILVGDFDDDFRAPVPSALTYEVCYADNDCLAGDYCEDVATPAGPYTDFVSAICTFGCFDDLDCPISEFNLLPGACVDHAFFGGRTSARICVERCEFDTDCDVAAGFGCVFLAGDRLCAPVR